MAGRNAGRRGIEDHIRILVLEAGESPVSGGRTGIPLERHLTAFVVGVVDGIHHDQIGLIVRSTVNRQPERQHHAVLNRGRTGRDGCDGRIAHAVTPEGERGRIDPANGVGVRVGNDRLQAVDLIRQRPRRVEIGGEVVLEGAQRVLNPRFGQVDDLFLAGVDAQFAA